ncbi:MAG: hypothetical protein ABR951_11590 [Candidatus Aminicenantales bacterium]|jgi:hypothetical protein
MLHQQRIICGLAIIFFLCGGSVPALLPAGHPGSWAVEACPEPSAASETDLSSLLGRAADYCDKLSRTVLNFVCRERIEEWYYAPGNDVNEVTGMGMIFISDHVERCRYVYDYQLVRDRAGLIQESRTLLAEQGKKVHVPNAPLKTHIFKHAYVVMGPLGLLSRNHQVDFEYKVVREEKVGGEPAVVIEATPKPGVQLDYLFGTIWLRKRDAGILKIQWNPSSIENYAGVEEVARQLGRKPDILMTSEYSFEKNGIRFPSRYTVKESYLGKLGRRFQHSETDVTYDQYKFFTVETEVKF